MRSLAICFPALSYRAVIACQAENHGELILESWLAGWLAACLQLEQIALYMTHQCLPQYRHYASHF